MPKPRLKIGDNVQLVSGGPHMTVIRNTKGQAECCWFDKEQKERRSKFPEAALMHTPPSEIPDEQLIALAQQIAKDNSKQ